MFKWFRSNRIKIFGWRIPRYVVISVLALLIAGAAFASFSGGPEANVSEDDVAGRIELFSLLNDGQELSTYTTTGVVRARENATLRAQSAGVVDYVAVSLGANVGVGQVILQIENSSERAALLRAEGIYEAAVASRNKLVGTESVSGSLDSGVASAEAAFEASQKSALNTYISAFASVEDAVRTKTDPIFTDPSGVPDLRFSLSTVTYGTLEADVEKEREDIEVLLNTWGDKVTDEALFMSDIEVSLDEAIMWSAEVQDFLLEAFQAVNASPRTDLDIDSWKAQIALARSSVSSARASLISARSTYVSARSSQNVQSVGKSEDLQTADAQVKQARAGVLQAQSALEKTIVRAPISGSVIELDVKPGQFVSSFEEVGVVANTSGKEVVVYVPAEVASRVNAGNTVRVGSTEVNGVVSAISKGLNRSTQQIEVRVAFEGDVDIVVGERTSVHIVLDEVSASQEEIRIPLNAIKIEGDVYKVFFVEGGVLASYPVTVERVDGTFLIITFDEGLPESIVADVRGLREGEEVVTE